PASSFSRSMTPGSAVTCASTGTSVRDSRSLTRAGASRPRMLVISGASGNLGRATALRVAELLQLTEAAAADGLILTSRSPAGLQGLVPGASTRMADFDRPDSLREAFTGAS